MLRRAGLIGRPTTELQQHCDRSLSASEPSERDPDALLTTLLHTLTTTNITDIALLAAGSTEVVCPDHRTPAALPRDPAGGERAVPRALDRLWSDPRPGDPDYVRLEQLLHAPHTGDVVKISALSGCYQSEYAGAIRLTG